MIKGIYKNTTKNQGFLGGSDGKESACNARNFNPWIGKIPWKREWQPTPVFLLENPMDRGDWQTGVENWLLVHGVPNEWLTLPLHKKQTVSYLIRKTKSFFSPLRSRTRQGCLISPLLFNNVLDILTREIRQEKEITDKQFGKEEIKLAMWRGHDLVYKTSKEIYNNLTRANKLARL